MAKVFISHASGDIAVARELHRWLIEGDHEVFLDQDPRDGIAVGTDPWNQRLQDRLRWANAMVCVVTSAYEASAWCTAEIRLAQSLGTRLLPVQAEPGIAHGLLKSIQHTDLTPDRKTIHAALTEALRQIDEVGDPYWPDDRSPFPGLSPFDIDLTRAFFARDREVEQLTELLRSMVERAEGAVLLVVGPSGCGKSSLLRAGLLPRMAGEPGWWTLPPIVPGADPVAALARELATASRQLDLNWTAEHVRHQLHEDGLTGLAEQLLGRLRSPAQRLLVVVDQFEELLKLRGLSRLQGDSWVCAGAARRELCDATDVFRRGPKTSATSSSRTAPTHPNQPRHARSGWGAARLDVEFHPSPAAARPIYTTNPSDFTGLDDLATVVAVPRP